jgi:serine/threonine protein kinase
MLYLVADYYDLGLAHRDLKPGNVFIINDESSYDGH